MPCPVEKQLAFRMWPGGGGRWGSDQQHLPAQIPLGSSVAPSLLPGRGAGSTKEGGDRMTFVHFLADFWWRGRVLGMGEKKEVEGTEGGKASHPEVFPEMGGEEVVGLQPWS